VKEALRKFLKDKELMNIPEQQLFWIAGENPFGQSTIREQEVILCNYILRCLAKLKEVSCWYAIKI